MTYEKLLLVVLIGVAVVAAAWWKLPWWLALPLTPVIFAGTAGFIMDRMTKPRGFWNR